MNVHRYDEEQRLHWVNQRRSKALSVKQILEQAQISRATFYNWLAEFPETPEPDAAVGNATEPELKIEVQRSASARLQMLQEALAVTDESNTLRQAVVRQLIRKHTLSVAQACAIAGLKVADFEHKVRKPEADDRDVYEGLFRLLEEDPSRQFEDLISLLRIAEPSWPRKQIRRIYKEGRLYQRRARKKATPVAGNARRLRPDATWMMGLAPMPYGTILFAVDVHDYAGLGAVMIPETESAAAEQTLMQFLADTAFVVGMPRKLRLPGIAPFKAREVLRWSMQNQVGLQTASLGKEENAAEWQTVYEKVSAAISSSEAAIAKWLEP